MRNLVLIHGWGFNGSVWDSVLPALREQFEVTVVDLPGYRARPAIDPVTLSGLAADVAAQLSGPACWLGWSLGGQVALQAALDCPQLVERMVLVAATPRFVQGGGWREAVKQRVLDDFGRELIRARETTIGRFLSLQMLGVEGSRELIRELKASLAESPRSGTLEAGLEILNQTDLRSVLGTINHPIHWIMGGRDQLVPPSAGVVAAAQMPHGSSCVVEGSGHAPFLSHPDQFLDEVIRFGA